MSPGLFVHKAGPHHPKETLEGWFRYSQTVSIHPHRTGTKCNLMSTRGLKGSITYKCVTEKQVANCILHSHLVLQPPEMNGLEIFKQNKNKDAKNKFRHHIFISLNKAQFCA